MMTEMKRLKVFLCHAHSDAVAVRDLFLYLRREGVDVWLDKESLLPGADWELEIRKAVRASDVVVVCLSKNFNQAGFRQKEVRIALDTALEKPEGEIFIIPARLERCETLESLRKWHWVDLFEEGGRQKLIYALRARGSSVGAVLRRHRGMPTVASLAKSQESRKKAEFSTAQITNQELKTSEGYETHSRGGTNNQIDRVIQLQNRLAMADPIMSARLIAMNGREVLDYLVKNRGKSCSYKSLILKAFPQANDKWATHAKYYRGILARIIEDLRMIIEDDPENPIVILDTGRGYKLMR